jgi:quinol monooxygenase YgiN
MPVIQTFTYTHATDAPTELIIENDWAKTLPPDQTAAFEKAFAAQQELIQAQITAGNLTQTIENGIVWTWKDQATCDAFVWNPEYKAFFDQYTTAINAKFNIVTTTT